MSALEKLKQRQWVIENNESYSCVNPTLVFNNEIHELRMGLLDKIEKLKSEVLPSLEAIYAQNNHVKIDEQSD